MRALAALCASLLLIAAAGCGGDDEAATEAGSARFASAARAAVQAAGARDAVVLDVRTDEEVADGHAAGSLHVPLAELEAGRLPDIAKDARVFVYCRTGRRAEVAARILRRAGWRDVTNIGGLRDWEAAGGDVTG